MKRHVTRYALLVTIIIIALASNLVSAAIPGRWNKKTTDWTKNQNPEVGDWGFSRPGFPEGLYIHGVTAPQGKRPTNPVIYDNDEVSDVVDEQVIARTLQQPFDLSGPRE